jgi:hypothetical protein
MATFRLPSLTLAVLLAIVTQSPASAGVRLGSISVGAGFGYASGPAWPGYYPPFYYEPLAYGPWFGYPFGYPLLGSPVYLVPQPDKGQVNLQGSDKDAEVYLDDAYAGTTASLKKFWLSPGVYELEVRGKDQTPKKKRIYVLTGKTLKVSLE